MWREVGEECFVDGNTDRTPLNLSSSRRLSDLWDQLIGVGPTKFFFCCDTKVLESLFSLYFEYTQSSIQNVLAALYNWLWRRPTHWVNTRFRNRNSRPPEGETRNMVGINFIQISTTPAVNMVQGSCGMT